MNENRYKCKQHDIEKYMTCKPTYSIKKPVSKTLCIFEGRDKKKTV